MIAIKGMKMPKGCQRCKYFRKNLFGNGLDYSYSCMQGAKEIPMPWIRQMEERASDCPLVEIVTCKDCKYNYENSCDFDGFGIDDEYFCAKGERKEK